MGKRGKNAQRPEFCFAPLGLRPIGEVAVGVSPADDSGTSHAYHRERERERDEGGDPNKHKASKHK